MTVCSVSGQVAGAAGSAPTAAVLTASDRCSAGLAPDRSGVIARRILLELGFRIADSAIVPDEIDAIRGRVGAWAGSGIRLVLTTGGTGLGPRDRTPEAVTPLLDRELPGYGELLRSEGLRDTPMAVLSRSLAGSIGATLVIVLPGSPRAVESGLGTLAPTIFHALQLLAGDTAHSRSVKARNG
ncbi:MAG: MogA/MoaB family molybdenum cofactor biosynthesis protein [Acidobacteria bacterium]|nr:MogA/MoaB family molybdenum cofactor biosynthesis protein [Acidobacteriota bacterium]MYG74947.1 MogA/MoaB family molybdenum cofactor biosynthesis protein [Acidobacteriota bacterium]